MQIKRLTMDTDWSDLCYSGIGEPSDVERQFDEMARAGFDATTWDYFWCGTAMYYSKRYPLFENNIGWKSSQNTAATLKRYDPLALALKLGKERNIKIMPYMRLMEEAYAPFDGDDFFKANPQYWWQTRNGLHKLVGWPCYNYPEVREHMLERLDDVVEQGVDSVLFDICRSHIGYLNGYRESSDGSTDCFGFNKPVVDEFKRRYGVDLSTFDYMEDVTTVDHAGLPFTCEFKWVGCEEYDRHAFRRLLGEGYELFIREAKARHPELYIAVQSSALSMGGADNEDWLYSVYRLDVEALIRDKVIDEIMIPGNFRNDDLSSVLYPRFDHVRDSSRQASLWLNDFFTPDGGGEPNVTPEEAAQYVNKVLESEIDGAVIHQSSFLMTSSNPSAMWKEIARLKK